MRSDHPKVLSNVLFKPMLHWVIDAARGADVQELCVVTGCQKEMVEESLRSLPGTFATALQAERRGTGHAVMMAKAFLEKHVGKQVLILCGDAPLMDSESIRDALALHRAGKNAVTIIAAELEEPKGYGRIVRHGDDRRVTAIVEEKDADEETRRITEVNSGAYWFDVSALLRVLDRLTTDNEQHEYYLTDAVSLLIGQGERADAYVAPDADTVRGANDCIQLQCLNERARRRHLDRLLREGVEIPCMDGVMVGPDVTVGSATLLLPGTILRGRTTIGSGCELGPNTMVSDSTVGDHVKLNSVQCYESVVEDGVTVGPFVHIRPNSILKSKVKVGDFVEIKNSVVGEGTKVPHLTYIGDSDVGKGVNFGCGCVTVNYDGITKARCKVGDNAFIGCNTNLIAPVEVGDNAYTAAGSTITDPVPSDALAIARARQTVKKNWRLRRGNHESASK